MRIATTPDDVRATIREVRRRGDTVGFAPTMGALHDGHAALIEEAKQRNDFVVVSIFVNPLQFNDPKDLAGYPITAADDEALCNKLGVDLLYRPDVADMYPSGFDTRIEPGSMAELLEGRHRPGHFSGMATVVLKLFSIVSPDDAYFGKKDYQQLAIVRRMVVDLNLDLRIHGVETVRELDGLAMSSRNVKLAPDARSAATALSAALFAARREITNAKDARRTVDAKRRELSENPMIDLEYFEVVDADTLTESTESSSRLVLLVAARVGGVRLIDNVELSVGHN